MAEGIACHWFLLTFRNISSVLRLTPLIVHIVDPFSWNGRKNYVVSIPQEQEIFITEKMTSDTTLLVLIRDSSDSNPYFYDLMGGVGGGGGK